MSSFEGQLSADDEARLWTWNAKVPVAVERCLHHVFEDQARASPTSPAICSWDANFTYSELNDLSSRLAGCLINLGVGQETLVPLCFEKSAWAVVAMLGVLKAGGAFVPLNPTQSESRMVSIIKRTKAHLILTSEQYADINAGFVQKIIPVNGSFFETTKPSNTSGGPIVASSRQAAYVMFTSGSTGEPKGVLVEHEAACTSLLSHGASLALGSDTRILQFASYSFDVSITEIFATLVYGGCICVPSESDRLNDLAGFISTMNVGTAILTPTVARGIDTSCVSTLKTLIIGAEMVSPADLTRWKGVPRLMQGYGPTECTVISHLHTIAEVKTSAQTIGKAVGCVSWVVDADDDSKLVPIGTIGELVIEGSTLARGYLDDAGKTKEAFVQDPVWLLKGSKNQCARHGRVYKTGDLVHYNNDGTIEIVGRKDTQIKIRGQRVELGEIEHHLQRAFPEARCPVAELISPIGGRDMPQLAAFLQGPFASMTTSRNGLEPMTIAMESREYLTTFLPPAMVPTVYFALSSLPVTISGKTDRKRLRELGSSFSVEELLYLDQSTASRSTATIGTDDEGLLRDLWAQVLGVRKDLIDCDNDFFQLGGNSISAMELVAEARKLGRHWKVSQIFNNPRLTDQALALGHSPATLPTSNSVSQYALLPDNIKVSSVLATCKREYKLHVDDIEDVYPCTPVQEHLLSWTAQRPHALTLQLVLRISHEVTLDAVCMAVEKTVSSTPILRTRLIRLQSKAALQVVMKDRTRWQRAVSLQEYLQKDSNKSMDFGSPLARYALISDQIGNYLVLTLHHALWDRWSLPIMLESLGCAYDGKLMAERPGYNTFIEHAMSADKEASQRYWRSYLAHARWKPFPKVPSGITTPRATETLKHSCSRPPMDLAGVTLSALLRAAWAIVLSRCTGSDDVLFGTTVFGRHCPLPGIEKIIGPTIATVPIRVRTPNALEMSPHEHEWLRGISCLNASEQSAFEFQTLFVVQPREHQVLRNPFANGEEPPFLLGGFDGYALIMQCEVFADRVTAVASFDARTLQKSHVENVLRSFDRVMKQLASSSDQSQLHDIDCVEVLDYNPSGDVKDSWKWFFCCAALYTVTFLYGLDFTIAAVIQPSIVAALGDIANLGWIGSGFPLGSIVIILPVGYAYGLFEMKAMYLSTIAVFTIGSVLCGAASNMNMMIIGRVIAGAGGAGMYLGVLNYLGSLTSLRDRPLYMGLTGFTFGIGVIVGPIIGGSLATSSATWRWAFYINACIFGLILPFALLYLPQSQPRPEQTFLNKLKRMDWLGIILVAATYATYTVAFTLAGSTWAWDDRRTIVLTVFFGLILLLFVAQQYFNLFTSETWKIFPTKFLWSPALIALFTATSAAASALYITTYYVPLIFQYTRFDSPTVAAVRLLPLVILFIFCVVAHGIAMPNLGYYMPWYVLSGTFILVGGALMYTVTSQTSVSNIYGYIALLGIGTGLSMQASYSIAAAKVKAHEVPSVISFINVAQIGSGVLSLTMAGAIFQNLAFESLSATFSAHGYNADEVRSALAGTKSAIFEHSDEQLRELVIDAVVEAIDKVFILVIVAGAVVLLSGLAMPRERLFSKKTKTHAI